MLRFCACVESESVIPDSVASQSYSFFKTVYVKGVSDVRRFDVFKEYMSFFRVFIDSSRSHV